MTGSGTHPALSVFSAAAETPDRLAVVAGDSALTWAELAQRAREELGPSGDDPGPPGQPGRAPSGRRPLPLVAGNDLRSLIRVHGCIAAGIPMLLLHPRLTETERARLIEAADASGGTDAVAGAELPSGLGPEAILAVVHTSGTSGTPRGVALSRRAFLASARASAANLGWEDEDRWLLPLPVAHVGGLSIVTRCLIGRRTVVLADANTPEALLGALRQHRVTLLSVVPTQLERVLRIDPTPAPPESLRAVLLGGAPASTPLLERAADAGWPVLTTYGLTEACSQVTTQRYGTTNRGQLGSGRPLEGVEVRIGPDDEIQVRGPTLLSSHVPPAGTSPFLPDGWFPTGDRGRLDAGGRLHVFGRRSDRIITGGENVDPVEVEEALERLPSIAQACVFGTPDPEWGEVVSAAVVLRAGATVDDAVRDVRGLAGTLAGFKRPRRVAALYSLPVNATGKLDRGAVARTASPSLRRID